jgi:hypothetical protein
LFTPDVEAPACAPAVWATAGTANVKSTAAAAYPSFLMLCSSIVVGDNALPLAFDTQ